MKKTVISILITISLVITEAVSIYVNLYDVEQIWGCLKAAGQSVNRCSGGLQAATVAA